MIQPTQKRDAGTVILFIYRTNPLTGLLPVSGFVPIMPIPIEAGCLSLFGTGETGLPVTRRPGHENRIRSDPAGLLEGILAT